MFLLAIPNPTQVNIFPGDGDTVLFLENVDGCQGGAHRFVIPRLP